MFRSLARITETADPNVVPGRAFRMWLERPLRSRLYVRPGSTREVRVDIGQAGDGCRPSFRVRPVAVSRP